MHYLKNMDALFDGFSSRVSGRLISAQDPVPALPAGKRAAAVLALVTEEPVPRMLFTRRPDSMDRHPGQVAFPGGKLEAEESFLQAAQRETLEEIGVGPEAYTLVGRWQPVDTVGSNYWVVPYLGLVTDPDLSFEPDSREVADIFWVELRQFFEKERHRPCAVTGPGFAATVDYWDVDTDSGLQIVWGATGAMMRYFLQRVFDLELPRE